MVTGNGKHRKDYNKRRNHDSAKLYRHAEG